MRILILLFFLLSGACGLVYEVVWTRLLTLVIGSTTYSITTVLVAFMGGLALGSYLGGKWIDKKGDPLLTYGILEGLIGIYCVAVPFIVKATEPLFAFFYNRYYTDQFYLYSLARFFVCGAVLLVPTTMMGATLPILSKYLIRRKSEIGWDVGRLYAINTLGAVLGSFGAGFILLPYLGKWRAILLAATANILIATIVLAYRLVLNKKDSMEETKPAPESPDAMPSRLPVMVIVALVAYAMNGFAGMSYQIAWTRAMSLSFGASTYTFSMIVTVFILGLAFGSGFAARISDRIKNPAAFFGWIEVLIGFISVVVIWALGRLPLWMVPIVVKYKESYNSLLAAQFGIVFVLIVIPAFLMGMTFPFAVKIVSMGREGVGRPVGLAYGWNTAGAITGSFIAGFVLIPFLGIQMTISAANIVNLLAGSLLFVSGWALTASSGKKWKTLVAVLPLVAGIGLTSIQPKWDNYIMDSGPFVYADGNLASTKIEGFDLEYILHENDLLFHKEGVDTTVGVMATKDGRLRFLRVNGKTDASTSGDMVTQLLVGHIPMMLAKKIDNVMILGLATGVTLGAVTRYDAKNIDVIEISDAVAEASHFFDAWNHNALEDPRVHLIMADGRNHLDLTDKKYNVIISEPSNPWISGISSLFTKEYFERAREKLEDGGVFCAWLQAYKMRPDEFRMVMRTFREVFPDATMWEAMLGVDYFLVGTKEKLSLDPEKIASILSNERVAEDLRDIGVTDPWRVMSFFFMDSNEMEELSEGFEIHTDDRLQMEYRAPKYLNENTFPDLYRDVLRFGQNVLDARMIRGTITPEDRERINRLQKAREYFLMGMHNESMQRLEDARQDYEKSIELDPGSKEKNDIYYSILMDMGFLLVKRGEVERAMELYEKAKAIKPDASIVLDRLGVAFLAMNKIEEARQSFLDAVKRNPRDAIAQYNLGYIAIQREDYQESESRFRAALEMYPSYADALNGMGVLMIQYQRRNDAVSYFEKAIKVRPNYADAYKNLGLTIVTSPGVSDAKKREGVRYLERALELDPKHPDRERIEELISKTNNELGGSGK